MLIRKGFKYRIYPTPEQAARLSRWDDALRFLWNLALDQRLMWMAKPRGYRRYPGAYDQQRELTGLRAELPWLADVPCDVEKEILVDLDAAWQRCFQRLNRTPRWKRKGVDFLGMKESRSSEWNISGGLLKFPKIGSLIIVAHRPLEGRRRSCTIVRDGDQWFASITCEIEVVTPAPVNGLAIGIDRGVVNVTADSDGKIVENPRRYERAMARLAHAQRVVSRRRKGSKNREKAKHRVMRLQRTTRRQREHALHGLSTAYANSHGTVVVERLQIRSMVKRRNVARSISGMGWGRFVEMLRYKLSWNGGALIEVNPAYTSQTCADCGWVAKESRRTQSEFSCVNCGVVAHADVNAARNILSRGIHGGAVCGGVAVVKRPAKQKLRYVKRGTKVKANV